MKYPSAANKRPPRGGVFRSATVNIYRKGDTQPRYSLNVPLVKDAQLYSRADVDKMIAQAEALAKAASDAARKAAEEAAKKAREGTGEYVAYVIPGLSVGGSGFLLNQGFDFSVYIYNAKDKSFIRLVSIDPGVGAALMRNSNAYRENIRLRYRYYDANAYRAYFPTYAPTVYDAVKKGINKSPICSIGDEKHVVNVRIKYLFSLVQFAEFRADIFTGEQPKRLGIYKDGDALYIVQTIASPSTPSVFDIINASSIPPMSLFEKY